MKNFTFIVTGFLFVGCVIFSEAQILKNIDKRIENKVKQRVDRKVDKTIDKGCGDL